MNTLQVNSLSYEYDNFKLNDINLKLKESEILGLVGANGAGKTTIIKCITGQLTPKKGEVILYNNSIIKNPEEFKHLMGYVCEDTDIYPMLKAKNFIKIIKRFYSDWDDNRFNYLSSNFDLDLNKTIKSYSKGMKVKLHLAISLSHNAKLLIMDEPTSGLDPFIRKEMLHILKEEAVNNRATVLFSTHIIEDIFEVADKVAFISKGKLVFNERKDELITDFYKIDARSLPENLNKYIYYKKNNSLILKVCSQNGKNDIIKKNLEKHHLSFNNLIEFFESNVGGL